MNYIIGQVIGMIAFIISLMAYHRKSKKKILGNMVISNILNLVHYLLIGAFSGCVTKVVAILRDSLYLIKDKYKILSSIIFPLIFIIIYIIAGIVTFSGIWSIFPIIAAIIYILPVWYGTEKTVRRTAVVGYFLWLIYNICVFSISGIVSNIISIISTGIAIKNNQ